MKVYIHGGVRPSSDNFRMDYTYNLPDDIIEIAPPQLYKSSVKNHIYWFGYQFKFDVSSKERTKFIRYLKGLEANTMSDLELTQFIELPLGELHKQFDMYDIDCIVYPISNRSKLVNKMISVINGYVSHDARSASYRLVKSAPQDIDFDWEAFERDNSYDDNKYAQMTNYVTTVLLPKIHALDYFSLAQNVKPKYRKYIKDYLGFLTQEDLMKFSKLQGSNILVVDDINTSGATIDEILRILDRVNSGCNIFVFTLIGNF